MGMSFHGLCKNSSRNVPVFRKLLSSLCTKQKYSFAAKYFTFETIITIQNDSNLSSNILIILVYNS